MTPQKSKKTVATAKNVQVTETKQVDVFMIIKHENKYKILLGNTQISQREFDKMSDAENYINEKPYELIYNGALYLMNKLNQENK